MIGTFGGTLRRGFCSIEADGTVLVAKVPLKLPMTDAIFAARNAGWGGICAASRPNAGGAED